MQHSIKKFSAMLLLLSTVACKGLPEAYQGTFQDREKGLTLNLTYSSASISFRNGKTIEEDGQEVSYQNLVQGIRGLYIKAASGGGLADVHYIRPQKGTKQSDGGLIWYKAELIYTQMDTERERPVSELKLVRCADGIVTVDTVAQRWQLGCPAGGATTYNLKRVKNREVFNPFNL